MTAVEHLVTGDMQELARKHLWMHFTPHGRVRRGTRCRSSCAARAATSATSTGGATSTGSPRCSASTSATAAPSSPRPAPTRPRSSASSRTGPTRIRTAIELAARVADLAPGDLNRVFFTSGGSEAVESALKLCRQYHKLTGEAGRYKVISRKLAYHGTTMGALTATGIPGARRPFEPLFPGCAPRANTNPYRGPRPTTRAEAIRERISSRAPRRSRA